ncbi:MAG: ATP-binding protein [Fibrobacterales bacterium]
MAKPQSIIYTVPDACRVCFTCVRECPVKAIKVEDGQAQIVSDRCILCGNCVMVCSQNAKQFQSISDHLGDILDTKQKVIAIVAPSFPAEFEELSLEQFVGSLKAIGFDYVVETAFGADLVAEEYRKEYERVKKVNAESTNKNEILISTSCPAVVSYVEKYVPELVENLAKIVSPMVATAHVAQKIYGEKAQIVFVGPCIAKKAEAMFDDSHAVKAVLTFKELRELFDKSKLEPEDIDEQDFDPPFSYKGALFPITRGLPRASSLNMIDSGIVSIDGKNNLAQFFKELTESTIEDIQYVDALCCEGCMMGPGMTSKSSKTKRTGLISKYAKRRISNKHFTEHKKEMKEFIDISLKTSFSVNDQRIEIPSAEVLKKILNDMGKFDPLDELNCGACGYATCVDHAIAIHKDLAEDAMCLPYTIDKLRKTADELSSSNVQLKETQEALQHSEKMASMGRLSAGIAHEINNPLGVILLYSNLLLEECGKYPGFQDDLEMIIEQTQVCQKIVGGLLNFSHKDRIRFEEVNVVSVVEKASRSLLKPNDIFFVKQFPETDAMVEVDTLQMSQVITNIINNAMEVMPDGGEIGLKVLPGEENVRIEIIDSGPGIESSISSRIFEPFFTTKTIGQGTGLGLAVSYGIVKNHKGTISFESNTDFTKGRTGTTFVITIPVKQNDLP